MIVGPFRSQTPVRNFSLREAYAALADLCSCTDDTREQKKKKKTTQVLRRLPRLRMFRHLAPTLAEAVFLRTSAASDLVNGQAIRGHSRSLLDPGRHQRPATDECLLVVVVACPMAQRFSAEICPTILQPANRTAPPVWVDYRRR